MPFTEESMLVILLLTFTILNIKIQVFLPVILFFCSIFDFLKLTLLYLVNLPCAIVWEWVLLLVLHIFVGYRCVLVGFCPRRNHKSSEIPRCLCLTSTVGDSRISCMNLLFSWQHYSFTMDCYHSVCVCVCVLNLSFWRCVKVERINLVFISWHCLSLSCSHAPIKQHRGAKRPSRRHLQNCERQKSRDKFHSVFTHSPTWPPQSQFQKHVLRVTTWW